MKALTQQQYCSPTELTVTDVADPIPGPGEVPVRVRAASLNPSDWHRVTGTPFVARVDSGLFGPKRPIPGTDLAGVVETAGADVVELAPGDQPLRRCRDAVVPGGVFVLVGGANGRWLVVNEVGLISVRTRVILDKLLDKPEAQP